MHGVFGRDGQLGAVADGRDEGLPLPDEPATGDIYFDRVFDRLPFEVAVERHTLEEIDRQHAAIEAPPEMKAPSA